MGSGDEEVLRRDLASPEPLTIARRAGPAPGRQDGRVHRPLRALALTAVLGAVVTSAAGCSGDRTTAQGPLPGPATSTSPAPQGDLSYARLGTLLLQPEDLPGLGQRRQYASADLVTQATPQLALCTPLAPDAPHQTANVLAQSGRTGQANVFEVLSAYVDEAGATAAFTRAEAAARSCTSYSAQGVTFTVEDLAPVPLEGATGLHYRVTTPDVVRGDVRTLVRSGRYVLLVTGYGAPPDGLTLLDFQADVARKALARLTT